MLLINLSKQADKFFSTLDPKQFKQVVKEIFSLAKNLKHTDIKKMISQSKYTYYRKDIGEYRLIFRIENSSITLSNLFQRPSTYFIQIIFASIFFQKFIDY